MQIGLIEKPNQIKIEGNSRFLFQQLILKTRREILMYMEDTNRKITFLGPKPCRAIQRDVQKQLENWISRKKAFHFIESESRYDVQFEYGSSDQRCFCVARIQIGSCTWQGDGVGRSIRESLSLALKHPAITFTRPDAGFQYSNLVAETFLKLA